MRETSQLQIGRMCAAGPSLGEMFYTRRPLCHISGATLSKSLRTLADGTAADTLREECREMGLLQNGT